MASQDDHDNSGVDDNAAFPSNVTIQTEVFDARLLFSEEPGHPFVAVTQDQINEGNSQEFVLTQEQDTQDTAVAASISVPANPPPVTTDTVPKKQQRKNPPRGKQYLLADKDMFLVDAHRSEFSGDANMLLNGFVLECPNKKTNDGRYRIDWERCGSLPEGVSPAMLRIWFPSTKEFRAQLDSAIARWTEQATEEEKARCMRTRKPTTSAARVETNLQTPPARQLNMEARAGLRTEASTISSLSSWTLSSRSSLFDRRPPRPPSPSNCPDAAVSDDNRSISTGTTRSSAALDSDSQDGSDVDEADNAYEVSSSSGDDTEEEKEESFCTHTEAPDLSVRARGSFGEYLKGLEWKFEPITENTRMREPYRKYSGRHGLKAGMAERFDDPLECLAECGGLTPQFMARLAANSNDYYYHHIKPSLGRNLYNNAPWRDITTEEMFHFFGIMLKISLATVDGGGYTAYFAEEDRVIYADTGRKPRTITLSNTKGWAQQYMSLNRFKQIRGAFHPEDKVASLGKDKCYQLRHILNQLNAAALRCFVMGPNMAFDEGGSPCRSRMCPVRQYNKDKPDKYRVDFYIL